MTFEEFTLNVTFYDLKIKPTQKITETAIGDYYNTINYPSLKGEVFEEFSYNDIDYKKVKIQGIKDMFVVSAGDVSTTATKEWLIRLDTKQGVIVSTTKSDALKKLFSDILE